MYMGVYENDNKLRKRGEVYETEKESCHFAGGDTYTADGAASSGKSGGSAGAFQRQSRRRTVMLSGRSMAQS